MNVLNRPLNATQMKGLSALMAQLIKEMLDRREKRKQRASDPDFDDEERLVAEEENEIEDEFLNQVYLCLSGVARICADSYLETFHTILMPIFFQMLVFLWIDSCNFCLDLGSFVVGCAPSKRDN